MTASIRGRKRRARGIASPQPETCHTCGRTGVRRSFRNRNGRRVCLNTAACMDRTFNPPPPPPPPFKPFLTIKWMDGMSEATAALAGFKPLGRMSDEGIQQTHEG